MDWSTLFTAIAGLFAFSGVLVGARALAGSSLLAKPEADEPLGDEPSSARSDVGTAEAEPRAPSVVRDLEPALAGREATETEEPAERPVTTAKRVRTPRPVRGIDWEVWRTTTERVAEGLGMRRRGVGDIADRVGDHDVTIALRQQKRGKWAAIVSVVHEGAWGLSVDRDGQLSWNKGHGIFPTSTEMAWIADALKGVSTKGARFEKTTRCKEEHLVQRIQVAIDHLVELAIRVESWSSPERAVELVLDADSPVERRQAALDALEDPIRPAVVEVLRRRDEPHSLVLSVLERVEGDALHEGLVAALGRRRLPTEVLPQVHLLLRRCADEVSVVAAARGYAHRNPDQVVGLVDHLAPLSFPVESLHRALTATPEARRAPLLGALADHGAVAVPALLVAFDTTHLRDEAHRLLLDTAVAAQVPDIEARRPLIGPRRALLDAVIEKARTRVGESGNISLATGRGGELSAPVDSGALSDAE